MTHQDLCNIGVKWLKRHGNGMGCQFAVSEIQTGFRGEQVDVFGYRCNTPNEGSFMVEVKTSRSDFLADFKKPHRIEPHLGVGKYRVYLCPEGVIQPVDVPIGWGLIWINGRGHVKPQNLDMHPWEARNVDGEAYLMARLISRFDDVEKFNQMLKESSRLSTRAWKRVDQLTEENERLRMELYSQRQGS